MPQSTVSRFVTLKDVRLDITTIPQDRLNIAAKVRSNLFPWNGQFSPQLVHAFLETYAPAGSTVLDPFMGSGTVLVEAGGLGLRAFGSEINPAAFKMAQNYTLINLNGRDRRAVLDHLDDTLHRAFGGSSLFTLDAAQNNANVGGRLIKLCESEADVASQRVLEALVMLLDFYKAGLTAESVLSTWRTLCKKIEGLPQSKASIDVANCDARSLPLWKEAVDLVVTSPPYINVFNYHQQYRASAEALGWDLLHVARSEIGSNRKHRGNRFLTVVQYCLDIAEALNELCRVCKPDARIIWVVGRESNVRKTPFLNGDIVTQIGLQCVGLKAECRQERVFKNKFGILIYEDIIHFRQQKFDTGMRERPSHIANEILKRALDHSPSESLGDLKDALARIDEVKPSTIYVPAKVRPRNIA